MADKYIEINGGALQEKEAITSSAGAGDTGKIPALDGAQFLVIPSFGSTSKSQDEAVLARGTENHLPVIEANVGVTLVVNQDQIVAVDRKQEGITFAEIDIPTASKRHTAHRDRVENEFMAWRGQEMPSRLARTKEKHDPR